MAENAGNRSGLMTVATEPLAMGVGSLMSRGAAAGGTGVMAKFANAMNNQGMSNELARRVAAGGKLAIASQAGKIAATQMGREGVQETAQEGLEGYYAKGEGSRAAGRKGELTSEDWSSSDGNGIIQQGLQGGAIGLLMGGGGAISTLRHSSKLALEKNGLPEKHDAALIAHEQAIANLEKATQILDLNPEDVKAQEVHAKAYDEALVATNNLEQLTGKFNALYTPEEQEVIKAKTMEGVAARAKVAEDAAKAQKELEAAQAKAAQEQQAQQNEIIKAQRDEAISRLVPILGDDVAVSDELASMGLSDEEANSLLIDAHKEAKAQKKAQKKAGQQNKSAPKTPFELAVDEAFDANGNRNKAASQDIADKHGIKNIKTLIDAISERIDSNATKTKESTNAELARKRQEARQQAEVLSEKQQLENTLADFARNNDHDSMVNFLRDYDPKEADTLIANAYKAVDKETKAAQDAVTANQKAEALKVKQAEDKKSAEQKRSAFTKDLADLHATNPNVTMAELNAIGKKHGIKSPSELIKAWARVKHEASTTPKTKETLALPSPKSVMVGDAEGNIAPLTESTLPQKQRNPDLTVPTGLNINRDDVENTQRDLGKGSYIGSAMIVRQDGQPFPTEQVAQQALANKATKKPRKNETPVTPETHKVIPVDGGYAIAPKSEQQITQDNIIGKYARDTSPNDIIKLVKTEAGYELGFEGFDEISQYFDGEDALKNAKSFLREYGFKKIKPKVESEWQATPKEPVVEQPIEEVKPVVNQEMTESKQEPTQAAKQSKSARRPRLEEAYAEVFAKPIEDWDANDFATIGAQAYYHDGKKHTDKEHDADNALVQKLVKRIINDGIKRGDSTTDIMSKVMFSAFDATFTIRQSGVDALEAYIEMRKEQVNSTTNPTVESNDITEVVADSDVTIKIVGNITEVFNSKSGLTHKVPTVLLNKMLSVKYYLEQVSSVESGILKPKEKEYISKLLSVFTQLRPNVVVSFLTDFSKIDKKIAEALPTSVGKSVDGNKIYIDVTNKTPVDMLELLTHEYHHAVTIETLDKTPLNTSYHIELAKVHEAVIKYLEDNPTLSAKARKRLSYALTAPAELLTVGTTEPIAIASLRKIDMGNGKTAYTVIMEQSIAIMKEQYSKTFTKEIEDSLNDLLSRTDRNFTTDEASSTKDSSIPSSEAASTTSDNTRTSDESIELQPDSNTESAATEVVNTESQLDTPTPNISENVKQFGYLGELLDDEDVEEVFKKEIEKILKLKADRASRKSPTFVSFNDLLTFNGGIEYFTRLAKNDPNISKLTKAANKLRDLMRIVQHQSTVEKYINKSISAQDLKDYLNKYPELKSIFEELREQKHSSLVHAVAGDIKEAKDVLSAEMEKLITLVGLLYIRAAFEKGQQYLIDTNYADLSEVLFPYTVMLFSNKLSGSLQKNKVVGGDTKTLRGLVTPTEAALIDKIDGIPVGELSKEDFEMVKALVQNVVNGYFNQYEVLQYPRNKKKVYSDIVHNIIVEHLPKEGFALENFTPEEVIKGAVPQSFIWDFKKQSSTPTQNTTPPVEAATAEVEDGKVTVLQGLSKEVIAEERTKPLSTINLVKAYFSQKLNKDETKGTNPLVAVNNFMQSLPKTFNEVRAYISNYLEPSYKITDEQLKQLEQFRKFELGFSTIASNLFSNRYINNKYAPDAPTQNVILYFRDAKGNLDTNMLTAMAASAFQYLIVNGTEVGNKEEDVRKLLRLDAKAPLPYEVSSALQYVGADVKTVVRELGKSIYKSLGLSVDKQGDVDLQQRVELALGQLALDTLVESGYLKENLLDSTAITEISDAMIAAGYSTANTLGKVNKLTFVSSNVVFNDKGSLVINDEGKVTFEALKPVNVGKKEEVVLPTVEAIKEANEGTVSFLQDLFSTDNGYRMPELLEPTKFVQDSIRGTDAKVSEYQKELLTEAHKHASTMRKNTISVLNKLKGIGGNSKYLRQLINAWYDKESLEKVHILRRDSVIVAAEDIWNALENGLQWANIIAKPDGYAEFYSPQDVAQNSRMHTTATFFNEQANQVHRAMANKKEHNITLNIKSDSTEDLNNILRFFQAVGEGLEGLPLGSSINSQVPGYKFFTTDKVRGDHYVSSLLAYLFSEKTKPAIDAMITLIENDTIDTKQQEAISKFVDKGGMGIQSLQSLIAIAEYFKAIKEGKTNIEINTPFSSDGVNDGVASANILMGTATPELLQQVGMFLRQETGVQTESMQDNYMKGIEDYYVSFGNKIRETLANLANEKIDKEWAKATLALFTKLQLSKDDMKAIRKIAKTWSVPFNYSAGKAALQRALARDFLENIYDQFESIGGEALDNRKAYAEAKGKKDNDSMAALEIAYAGLKRDVQTLETNIQNALGYGFLAPSSTKVRQVRGSLYRSLSDIKLPVSRPENLLSFTFNTGSVEIIEVITTSNLDKNGEETSSTKNSFVHTGRDAERIIEKYLMSASTAMFGKAAWEATEEFAGKFIASRDLFTEIQNSTFSLYNQLRNALIDAKIESKKDKTFGGYFTLTIAEMEEIDNKLLEFAPILKTVFSIKATSETDALASGLRLYDSTYTTSLLSKRPDLRQVITRYTKRDGTPATTTTNLGREVLEKGGVKNGATAIQSIDAFVSATVQAIFGILNAHDAAFFGLDKFVAGTLLQNETYLEAMTKYHFGLEHAESLLRSYKGLESVVQSLGLKKEYADTLSQLFEQVLLGEEVKDKTENVLLDVTGTAILSGGIVGALNDMLLLEEKETFNSNGRDIEEVLEVLVKTLIAKDISKLNQLKNLHSVHHFSGEGGQVLVTEEHIKEMDKQIKLLKAKEKELLALITKEADGIAIDNKSITEYLTENKGKDIKYTVFKPYLELNSKPEHKAVLGLIEKLIPTGLTIRYQEQDIATEGYGNYDEKTNTITITAIPDSKVSIALVIHELLHSALAQRINTLEEAERTGNTKGLEKAIAALNSVKALRETIIGKDGLAYLELKKVIEGKAKGKSFKDYKIELETLRTSLNAKFDKENKDYANIVAQLKEVQANINEVNRFFGLVDKLKQEQKEAVIAQPTYTVATGAIDEAGNAVERVVTRLSIINKFENIHEFISYGLTDRRVQAVLAAIETPVNSEFKESTTKRLSNFVRDFVLKVANLLGLKGQNATLLVPFYIEVGKLIDEITQASVPPTPSNRTHQSTTDYNDSVNEMDSLTVMQGLPHSNSEFSQHLNNIITDSIGQLYKADDTARQRINEIQNLQASEARNAGFSLSAKEAIVQQALQLAVETYMLTNAGNLNISQLFKVFKEAKAKMNEESFHNGDWNTATRLERSIAKKKYDFIFDTTKKGFEARFISMALASEEVHNLLGFNTISPKPSKEKTWFDTANSWLKYAISWLANKYVKLNPSNPVHKQISQLVDNLVKLDIRSRQETVAIWEHAWNLIGKATTPLNVLAKASKDKLAANNFLLNSKYLPLRAVGAIAALDAKAVSESIPKAITSMRNELRPNERLGEAMNAMLEASAATGMRKVMDVLIRQGNQNAHERQNISDGTKKSILSWFKEPNKLTKRQHLATTNVILRADLQALTGKFELEEVMDLIGDEVTLNNEIKVLEQSIAKEANGNGMLVASKLLAKYMVTIIGGNGLVKNARAISVGLGTHYQQADVTNVDEALVENIDLLVSMYALKYTYQGDKDIVTSLYKKEPEALLGILNLHYGLVEQAKTLFKDNPLNFNKGWLPDIANPYKGIKYAESKEEVETLQSLGWQLITPTGLKKDPLDITETKYMMIHNDMAYQRIVSGAVDLGNPSRKGNEVASKWNGLLTPIVKGRNASSQQLSKIPYDKFDPFKQEGGLIAAYDTEGYVIGYSYEMEGSTRNSLLDRNNNFADLLGAYAGANFYKPVKEYQSKKVADVLFQDYKDNFKKNPNAYLKLSKDSKDPRVAEMWRMLPHDFKQRATELYGKGEPIVIRNEAFLLAFGFKKYTVANIFNKLAKDRNAAEKAFVIFANTLLGNPVANMFSGTVADKAVKVEKAIQDIMRVVKDFIVIRSIDVLWDNVLSNLFTLMAHGINPITAIKNWSFAVANVRAYQTQNAELIQLRNDLLAGKDVKQTEQRIGVLEAQLKRNPITKYVEAGLLSSIVEDVTIQDADYTYTSQFKQKVDNATGWIPNAVKTAGNWLILSPSTQGYQFLATTTQLSDFVAKYTLAEHLQKGGVKFDEAVLEASQTFINYDVPTSRGMQYANDIGLFMFTKFFLRIQAVLYKLLDKRMASVIGQQIAVDQFTNFQGVLDPLAVFHIGNSPFEASVFNAHSALFDVGVF